mmetsp:Transcript_21425/g.35450  ORF Transcript_21425/g.35450 Transcript_21425/m.35450 type:complete len:211 (-) Transcript_21425:1457-2089(-)
MVKETDGISTCLILFQQSWSSYFEAVLSNRPVSRSELCVLCSPLPPFLNSHQSSGEKERRDFRSVHMKRHSSNLSSKWLLSANHCLWQKKTVPGHVTTAKVSEHEHLPVGTVLPCMLKYATHSIEWQREEPICITVCIWPGPPIARTLRLTQNSRFFLLFEVFKLPVIPVRYKRAIILAYIEKPLLYSNSKGNRVYHLLPYNPIILTSHV